jgi:hypothetical protein
VTGQLVVIKSGLCKRIPLCWCAGSNTSSLQNGSATLRLRFPKSPSFFSTDRPSRLISHALIYILLAYCIAFSVATALQCIPLEYQWNKDIPGGKCFDVPLFWKSLSIPNIVTDVIILVLPIPTILRLRLSTPQKIGLFTVFLSGSMCVNFFHSTIAA